MSYDKFVYTPDSPFQFHPAQPPSPTYVEALRKAIGKIEDPEVQQAVRDALEGEAWNSVYSLLNENGVLIPMGK